MGTDHWKTGYDAEDGASSYTLVSGENGPGNAATRIYVTEWPAMQLFTA